LLLLFFIATVEGGPLHEQAWWTWTYYAGLLRLWIDGVTNAAGSWV